MKIISRLLPQQLRYRLRRYLDSFYSTPLPDKETIGDLSQWTIVTGGLTPEAVIYSGGVGEDISFEQELIRRFGVKIFIFDPSPVAVRTIARANSESLLFTPVGLAAAKNGKFSIGGGTKDSMWFKAGAGADLACTSLLQEMEKNGHNYIDLLKIDIEGFEYEVLESCLAAKIPIRQICVEFHDFFSGIPKVRTKSMIRSLKSHGFRLIHRHRHDHTFIGALPPKL